MLDIEWDGQNGSNPLAEYHQYWSYILPSMTANSKNFNRHMLSAGDSLNVAKVVSIQRNGKTQPFVARYVMSDTSLTLPPAPVLNWFVPMIQMAPRQSYERIEEGRSFKRSATRLGSISIRDRRLRAFNVEAPVNNVSFYIPAVDLASLTDQMRVPTIDALSSHSGDDHFDPVMFHMANAMMQAIEHPAEAFPLFLDHRFDAVCIHIATTYGGLVTRQTTGNQALSSLMERRIKELLLDDLTGHTRLDELAQICGMSRGHFSRAFKRSTGMPPHRWVLSQRVDRAKNILRHTLRPISDVALECGFADQSHFTRVFTKFVGTSPAVWRRSW